MAILLVAALEIDLNPSHEASFTRFVPESFYLVIGKSVFAWEGLASLAIPIQKALEPELQSQFSSMCFWVTFMIVNFYLVFTMANWGAYGTATETVLTLNITSNRWR